MHGRVGWVSLGITVWPFRLMLPWETWDPCMRLVPRAGKKCPRVVSRILWEHVESCWIMLIMDKSWISWAPWVADLDSVAVACCSGTFVSKSLNIFEDFRICRDSKSEIGIPWRSAEYWVTTCCICSWSVRDPCGRSRFTSDDFRAHFSFLAKCLAFQHISTFSTFYDSFTLPRYLLLSARCAVCSTIIWVKFRSLTPKALMMVCCGAAQGRLNRDSWSNNW